MLQQADSWNRIRLPFPQALQLTKNVKTLAPFVSVLQGFGMKFGPVDTNHQEFSYNRSSTKGSVVSA